MLGASNHIDACDHATACRCVAPCSHRVHRKEYGSYDCGYCYGCFECMLGCLSCISTQPLDDPGRNLSPPDHG